MELHFPGPGKKNNFGRGWEWEAVNENVLQHCVEMGMTRLLSQANATEAAIIEKAILHLILDAGEKSDKEEVNMEVLVPQVASRKSTSTASFTYFSMLY